MLVKKFPKALMIKINVSKDYVNINVIMIRCFPESHFPRSHFSVDHFHKDHFPVNIFPRATFPQNTGKCDTGKCIFEQKGLGEMYFRGDGLQGNGIWRKSLRGNVPNPFSNSITFSKGVIFGNDVIFGYKSTFRGFW
jgi:hypothetical protein